MENLKMKGIETSIHYPPIHLFSNYQRLFGSREGLLPRTEFIGKHEVTLPLHPMLRKEDTEYVLHCVREALR
jgi:dTDP-4-amino-4,6-dideoxygalactose transaminase